MRLRHSNGKFRCFKSARVEKNNVQYSGCAGRGQYADLNDLVPGSSGVGEVRRVNRRDVKPGCQLLWIVNGGKLNHWEMSREGKVQ